MTNQVKFEFFNEIPKYESSQIFVAYIDAVTGERELFLEMKKKLLFPDYCGDNWDALIDSLLDLAWIDHQNIYLIHLQVPELEDEELLRFYLSVLLYCKVKWETDKARFIHIMFHESAELMIHELHIKPINK